MECPYLIGKKIYLRPLNPDDLEKGYLEWINDREVNRYLLSGFKPTSLPELKAYYEKIMVSPNDIIFAIVDNKTNKYIGNIKIGGIDWINRSASCGRLIGDKKYWGKGHGTEALQLAIEYAFNILNLNRVYTGITKENIGAIKSCERVGLKQEGVFVQCRFIDGEYKDAVQMAITRDRYIKMKKKS